MESALEGFIEKITYASSPYAVWAATHRFVENMGFSDCSLINALNGNNNQIASPRTITSYSSEFKKAYECEGMGEIDPFLHFHCFDLHPKQIISKNLSSFPKGSAAHRLFLDHVAANGGTGGIGIPARTRDQDTFGGWIMSSAETDDRIGLLIRDHGTVIQLASLLSYERIQALGTGSSQSDLLSERERECLVWLAAGLRVSMIADKLGIGESAINLYITNAKRKLGAKTREQAVAKAILSGEISL